MCWAETPRKVMIEPNFAGSYGTIIEGLKLKRPALHFYSIYMIRRLLYSFVLIFIYDWPFIQLNLIIGIVLFPVFF